jgi:two-component system, NtrC family, nitrogen regulation response regulator GlnG
MPVSPDSVTAQLDSTDLGQVGVVQVFVEGAVAPHLLLPDIEMTVGSSAACDLCVEHPSVSRKHATFLLSAGRVLVTDVGSTNGTRFLSARVKRAEVPVGGAVSLGKVQIRFALPQASQAYTFEPTLAGLIGYAPSMQQMFQALKKCAPSDTTVLLLGESGTGKEVIAQAIHSLSRRAEHPLVVFDCAGVNPNLVESELFGHVKGAFSGAHSDRAGALELASNGTLFIDEVGELPLDLQPKFLRALESREFRRVGDTRVLKCNARIVAATHRDLEAQVKRSEFRLDLFYRLAVMVVHVPPLRTRIEDIPHLVRKFARDIAGFEVNISPVTMAELQSASWPGNVRELRNAVQRVVALGNVSLHEQRSAPEAQGFVERRELAIAHFEKEFLVALLAQTEGNVSLAARKAKIARSQLYRLLTKHQLLDADESAQP